MEGRQEPIPQVHHSAILQLMEILGMDMEEAYRLLKSMNFNLENAIAMRLNPRAARLGQQNLISYQYSSESEEKSFNPNEIEPSIDHSQRSKGKNSKMSGYLKQKQYAKTYLIKKAKKHQQKRTRRKKKQQESAQKIEEQFNFNSALSNLILGQVCVTFAHDTYETFQRLWDQKKLVAIHCIRFINKQTITPEFQPILNYTKEIYKTAAFVSTFNKYLINFGLDPSHFDFNFYPFMKDFVKEGDQYSIIILRYNEHESKVQLVQKLPFSSSFKLSEPSFFTNLIQRLRKESNYLSFRPEKISTHDKMKIQENRKIRQQQEIQYFKQLNTVSNQLENNHELIQQKNLGEGQIKPEGVAQAQAENLQDVRRKNRLELVIYPETIENAISFKVRLPNSESIFFKLPRTQTAQYLFKYIENHQNDLGFNDETKRNFDIVIPLERISLLDKKCQTFQSIFGLSDMESLAIKEI